ncbi:MAG: type IV secretory system conjugative DNA transfer family protein [Minisyncoccia bacterium]
MEGLGLEKNTTFKNPQEELDFLRAEVVKREKELEKSGIKFEREKVISHKLYEYNGSPKEVLEKDYAIPVEHSDAIVLELASEEHDKKMEELVSILTEKGMLNTLSIVEKMQDPHIEDDFHRFLVQYVKVGFNIKLEKNPIFKALAMSLYEINLPITSKEDEKSGKKPSKEIISKMEQFYSGMLSISSARGVEYFSMELANSNHREDIIFYVAIPDNAKGIFEKHILSIFPEAYLIERKDDYNIFNEAGSSIVSVARLKNHPILPIGTFDTFDYDPMNVIINSFSKLSKETEGASIQVIVKPCGEKYNKIYRKGFNELNKGKKLSVAIREMESGFFGEAMKFFKVEEKPKEDARPDEISMNLVKQKISTPIFMTNIKIAVSAKTEDRAGAIAGEIESAFNQFTLPMGNSFVWNRVSGRALVKNFRNFSFRVFDEDQNIPLDSREIASLMHLPDFYFSASNQLKQVKSISAPAPLGMSKEGVALGVNQYRGVETEIRMTPEDRLRHFYIIGQTGTGKTTLLKNMIRQDIIEGNGVCMIDPHGSDIQDVLSYIPKERAEDVIYFDPSNTERVMALNMLEYDQDHPEQKTFVVNEMLSIFNKLFDMKVAGGPMFEQYFRNSVMLVLEDPSSGNTLLDVSRVLSNKVFRELKLSKCKNPLVVQFWKEVAEKAGGEASLANIVPYIVSKFDVFLANDIMRPIIAQEKSSFNFRDVMDNKKILLVNLAKGKLGDINSNLIGLIVVGKLLMSALSRVDSFGKADLPPFYLYIDEFQNVTTDSISTILSEARKYKLSLTVAHQFIAQLEEKIRDSVFGNVGSVASFRVSSEDAEYLEKQFGPTFSKKDLSNIENLNACVKMLSNGVPQTPFSIFIPFPPRGEMSYIENMKELSYLKYGRDRSLVEEEIMLKYKKPEVKQEQKSFFDPNINKDIKI